MPSRNKIRFFVLVFFIVYFAVVIIHGCSNNKRTLKRFDVLQQRYEKEVQLNQELKKKLEQLNNAEFIELTARQKLGLVKPGETVYKIIEE